MAYPKDKRRAKREVLGLIGLSVLLLTPIAVMVRKSMLQRHRAPTSPSPAPTSLAPQLSSATIALSPNGRFLAGFAADHLVIWDANTRRELQRIKINGQATEHLTWTGETIITNSGDFAQSWKWAPGQPLSAPIDESGTTHQSDINVNETQIDPTRDLKTHIDTEGHLQAFLSSSGKPFTFKIPAGLKLDEGSEDNWILLPQTASIRTKTGQNLARQAPALIAIGSMAETPELRAVSQPRATPTPTPAPTPTPSPRSEKWQAEQTALQDELSDVRDELQTPRSLPPLQRQQLSQRAAELEARLRRGEIAAKSFPGAPKPMIAPTFYGQIVAWDARSGQVLWRRRLSVSVFVPQLYSSPDGRIIAAVGTLQSVRMQNFCGIDFLDAATGKTLSRAFANDEFLSNEHILWLPKAVLCVPDRDANDNSATLSFFDARSGRRTQSWHLEALATDQTSRHSDTPRGWTCDATGTQWVFASPGGRWNKWTRSQIESLMSRSQKQRALSLKAAAPPASKSR